MLEYLESAPKTMSPEKPFNKYYRSRRGAILPLELRQSALDHRRRTARMEFRRGEANVRSFPLVRKYLKKVVDDYEERFGQYDSIFEAWHKVRVTILDSFGNPNYIEISKQLTNEFYKEHFTDPKTGRHLEDKYQKVQPVITEITNVVSRGK